MNWAREGGSNSKRPRTVGSTPGTLDYQPEILFLMKTYLAYRFWYVWYIACADRNILFIVSFRVCFPKTCFEQNQALTALRNFSIDFGKRINEGGSFFRYILTASTGYRFLSFVANITMSFRHSKSWRDRRPFLLFQNTYSFPLQHFPNIKESRFMLRNYSRPRKPKWLAIWNKEQLDWNDLNNFLSITKSDFPSVTYFYPSACSRVAACHALFTASRVLFQAWNSFEKKVDGDEC